MRKPLPFGKYLLLDRIAVGGMAEVFAAKTFGVEGFERLVAIKRILPTMVEDDEFITMFIDEARIAAQLSHANLVQIYELGKHDDTYFISMEYVSGRDVRLLIDKFKKKNQTVPIPMAVFIMAKMCEGLDFAHRKKDAQGRDLGIIHRDISPQNVLVSYEGDVKIIDFGIAKAAGRLQKTQAGILKGKFGYMSPEQVKGLTIDHRSDLYSCGVMLYEMLTGTKLFSGESDFSTLEMVRAGEVRAPSEINAEISPALERIVLKALAKDRDERYQWCSEFHDDLMRFLYSGNEVFSTKSLAAFMKEAFSTELVKEQDRQRRWHQTAPEETADFELATTSAGHSLNQQATLPPTAVPVQAREAMAAANGGAAVANGKVRIGPPSAFMTAELRLQDRTGLHEPFNGEAEKSPVVRSRPPPVGPSANDRSQLKTEAASLAELGLAAAVDEIDPEVEEPKRRSRQPAVPFDLDSRRRSNAPSRRPVSPEREPEPEPDEEEEAQHVDEQATRVKGVEPSNPSKPKPAVQPAPEPDLDAPPPRRGMSTGVKAAIGVLVLLILALAGFKVFQLFGAKTGSLAMTVSPKNAVVLIDGQKQKYSPPMLTARLPFGPHTLEVSAEGYETYEEDFTLDTKLLQKEVKLDKSGGDEETPAPEDKQPVAEEKAPVEPKEAKEPKAVKEPKEPAPQKDPPKETAPKERVAKVMADPAPYKPQDTRPLPTPTPTPTPPTPVVKNAAPGQPGGLNVFSSPPGAMLAVNGKMVGKTPQRLTDLPGGQTVELKLVAPGYRPVTLSQEVPSGSTETLKLTLEPVGGSNPVNQDVLNALGSKPANPTPAAAPGGTAKLTAMCLPTAQIVIDGKPSGRWTPISAANPLEVPAGHHTVLCEAANGARSAPQEMVMEAGNTVQYKAKVQ